MYSLEWQIHSTRYSETIYRHPCGACTFLLCIKIKEGNNMNPEFITICGSIYRKTAIDAVFVQRVEDENYAVHVVCNGVDSVCQSFRFFEDANKLRNAITKEVLNFI